MGRIFSIVSFAQNSFGLVKYRVELTRNDLATFGLQSKFGTRRIPYLPSPLNKKSRI
jgi:hypothetical protein